MIDKMADYLGVDHQTMVISLIIIAVLFVVIYIKITIDEKKGVDSQEKADIRKLINNIVPEGGQYMAAYAHSKEVYRTAHSKREVYHYYAVGFRQDRIDHMWIIPIGVEYGKIVYTEAVRVSAENLACVGGDPGYQLEMHFPDRKDKWIIQVSESNTKLGKECQVNIQQPEEAEAFKKFGEQFQQYVNDTLGVNKKGRKLKS